MNGHFSVLNINIWLILIRFEKKTTFAGTHCRTFLKDVNAAALLHARACILSSFYEKEKL